MLLAALALPLLMLAGAGLRARVRARSPLLIARLRAARRRGPVAPARGRHGPRRHRRDGGLAPASRSYALLLAAAATLAWNPRAWARPRLAALVRGRRRDPRAGRAARARASAQAALSEPARGWRGARRRARSPTASRSPSPPRSPPRRCSRITSARSRSPACPANLLALPAVAPAMWLGMVKAALGQLGRPSGQLGGRARALAAAVAASRYLGGAGASASPTLPGGRLALPARRPGPSLARVRRARRPRRSSSRRRARARRRRASPSCGRSPGAPCRAAAARGAGAPLAALALAAARAALGRAAGPPGHLTVRFLDVGQGDATLIQHPDGTAVLFDGGPPEAGVTRLLRKAGVGGSPLVVATHPSRDHHGGLAEVLGASRSACCSTAATARADPSFRALARRGRPRGVRACRAIAPLTLALRRRRPAHPGPLAAAAAARARRPRTRTRAASSRSSAPAASTCCSPPTPRARRCCRSTCPTSTP